MKNYIYAAAFICLLSIFVLAQKPLTAKVTGIVAGDTLTVTTKDSRQLVIHLAGIDAPKEGQDFEMNARQSLSMMAFGETVAVADLKKDCVDRLSASVTLKNKDLSVWAVESGDAWADSSCQPDETLVKKESSARENKVGLWRNPNAVRPADFLKGKKEVVPVKAEPERKIFAGLAPNPLPPGSNLYLGMTVDDFIQVCGNKGEVSSKFTAANYQSFVLNIPLTKENKDSGCVGAYSFESKANRAFKLAAALQ